MSQINETDVRFVLTKEKRLGWGYCPDKDAGGFKIVEYVPDNMLIEAFGALASSGRLAARSTAEGE